MREGFEGSSDTFLLFFWLCKRYRIHDEKSRVELLRKLVAAKRLKYHRDGPAMLKERNIIHIKKGDSPNA